MTAKNDSVCPNCGAPIGSQEKAPPVSATTGSLSSLKETDREYDHRGILLPRRTRVGGIITPQ